MNQSMLSVSENPEVGGLRYHMLETVREFGEEQSDAGESAEVSARTVAWAERFSREAFGDFMGGRQVAAAHRVEAEHDNLLAVLRYAYAEQLARAVFTVFSVIGGMWSMRGAHSEVFTWVPRLLELDTSGFGPEDVPGDLLASAYVLAASHMAMGGRLRAVAIARTRLRRLLATRTDISEQSRMYATLLLVPASGRGLARMLARAVRSPDPGRAVPRWWRGQTSGRTTGTSSGRSPTPDWRSSSRRSAATVGVWRWCASTWAACTRSPRATATRSGTTGARPRSSGRCTCTTRACRCGDSWSRP